MSQTDSSQKKIKVNVIYRREIVYICRYVVAAVIVAGAKLFGDIEVGLNLEEKKLKFKPRFI